MGLCTLRPLAPVRSRQSTPKTTLSSNSLGFSSNVFSKAALRVGFLRVCPFLGWVFSEAVLEGSHVGFL